VALVSAAVDTGLPGGLYCNIVNQSSLSADCQPADAIRVAENGKATFTIPKRSMIAFSVGSAISTNGSAGILKNPKAWKITVIFLKKQTRIGEQVFIRGGNINASDCDIKPSTRNNCSIPIAHATKLEGPSAKMVYAEYSDWRQNDAFLDFIGAETRQGTHNGMKPDGTPMLWTTDNETSVGFNEMNRKYKLGPDYWLVELQMDCAKTENGTFHFKGYLNGHWEPDVSGDSANCSISTVSPSDVNHVAECGATNIFEWSDSSCRIAMNN